MYSNCIHISIFGYFYNYCLSKKHNVKIKREISKIKEIVEITNNLDATNNSIYNRKLSRKEKRIEALLRKIANKNPEFLLDFNNDYCTENKTLQQETDPQVIARHIAQSFYDAYQVKKVRKNNIVLEKNNFKAREQSIVLSLTEQEKKKLDTTKNKAFSTFLTELKKCKYHNINRQLNALNKVLEIKVEENETKEEYSDRVNKVLTYAYHNIDMIFKKGRNYPFRKNFIKVLSKLVYIYDIKERTYEKINNYLKKSLNKELLDKYTSDSREEKKELNYGYEIPIDTSTEMLIKVNEDLLNEKNILVEKYKRGEKIKFDRPFSNSVQTKKVDIINAYFDIRYEIDLGFESTEDEFVRVVMNLCDLADELTDDMFKVVLFDAHDSSNLLKVQSYEKNEALRTLYSLYPASDRIEKYDKAKNKFEQVFKTLTNSKRDIIYKKVYEEKQKKHVPINELIPSKETIINNLVIRETKFIDSHAVEEFKHKATNYGKYLNYDLEIVARDIDVEDLPAIYQKIKRNITYTNFVDEIKPGEDRERKYKEARVIQRKTLAVAQEMIAKTILNKRYDREYDVSYDSYQSILNNIYENVLHEERLLHSYDDLYDEYEAVEKGYHDIKKVWDEKSSFVKALYLVVSKREG